MCFMKKVSRVSALRIWNTPVFPKKNAGIIFNFLWRIKKLGHTFCYNQSTGLRRDNVNKIPFGIF
jgi:hypothetical protein